MATIEIDDFYEYSYQPKPRYGGDRPPHRQLVQLFEQRKEHYRQFVEVATLYRDDFLAIARTPDQTQPAAPSWDNGWLPTIDGITIYTLISYLKPSRYLEVGSGNSTKFAALARQKHSRDTAIISIDPAPRAEIDSLCNSVIRAPLQDLDVGMLTSLMPGDVLFIDGSHRVLQNSDVTAFYLDILPQLRPGVIVGQHDIVLPWDYAKEWAGRMYSEQYLLAAVLLAAPDKFDIIWPACYVASLAAELLQPLTDPLWRSPSLNGLPVFGSSFWLSKK